MSDTTLRREVEMATLRNTNARLRGVLLDVLRGPYIHPIDPGQMFHGLYHKSRQWAGEATG